MFVAYSKKLQDIVHINDVKDLKDEFSCLNPYCTAKFYVRAVNSDGKSAHFAKWPKQHHIPGCPYAMEDGKYIDTGVFYKFVRHCQKPRRKRDCGVLSSYCSNGFI